MFCLSNSQRCCVETAKHCQAFSSPSTDPIIGLLFEFSRIKRRDHITERGLRSDISDNTERVLEVSSAYGSLSSVSVSKIEQFQRSCRYYETKVSFKLALINDRFDDCL